MNKHVVVLCKTRVVEMAALVGSILVRVPGINLFYAILCTTPSYEGAEKFLQTMALVTALLLSITCSSLTAFSTEELEALDKQVEHHLGFTPTGRKLSDRLSMNLVASNVTLGAGVLGIVFSYLSLSLSHCVRMLESTKDESKVLFGVWYSVMRYAFFGIVFLTTHGTVTFLWGITQTAVCKHPLYFSSFIRWFSKNSDASDLIPHFWSDASNTLLIFNCLMVLFALLAGVAYDRENQYFVQQFHRNKELMMELREGDGDGSEGGVGA